MGFQARSEPVTSTVPHDMMDTDRSAWMDTERSAWTVATTAAEFQCAIGSYFVTARLALTTWDTAKSTELTIGETSLSTQTVNNPLRNGSVPGSG
jgi:hypothetical protein